MGSVWSAFIGAIAALAGVWVTQILTNRREAKRDALRWAQERQQREFDLQKAALSDALSALHKWHNGLTAVNLYFGDPYERAADTKVLPGLETEAKHALAAVQLLCSEAAVNATVAALTSLDGMNYNIRIALEHFQNMQGAHDSRIESKKYDLAMKHVAEVYRDELAKLAVVPVVTSRSRRGRIGLPEGSPTN